MVLVLGRTEGSFLSIMKRGHLYQYKISTTYHIYSVVGYLFLCFFFLFYVLLRLNMAQFAVAHGGFVAPRPNFFLKTTMQHYAPRAWGGESSKCRPFRLTRVRVCVSACMCICVHVYLCVLYLPPVGILNHRT